MTSLSLDTKKGINPSLFHAQRFCSTEKNAEWLDKDKKWLVEKILSTYEWNSDYTIMYSSWSEKKIREIANYLCTQPEVKEKISKNNVQISYIVKTQAWILQNGVATLQESSSKWESEGKGKFLFSLESTVFPYVHYPHLNTSREIVKYFRDVVKSTAVLPQVNLDEAQWRFGSITYYSKENLDKTIDALTRKGFAVKIDAPYVLVKGNNEEIFSRQDLVVSIAKDALAKETIAIANDTTYHQSELSLHNILVARREALKKQEATQETSDEKEAVKKAEKAVTLDDCLKSIFGKLEYIAKSGSLIRRYAHDVSQIDPKIQKELAEVLTKAGYEVFLEDPYINRRFVGIVNGWDADFLNQHLIINLPS